MQHLRDIFTQNIFAHADNFDVAQPVPMVYLRDFLPDDTARAMFQESETIPRENWTTFTRNGSHMIECKKLQHAPVAFDVVNYLHSSSFLHQLERLTNMNGLIPDPHLVGAGYSKSYRGDTLKKHTDFNWNDSLRLHRALSLIIYLNPEWQDEWGGSLDFYDRTGTNIVRSNPCLFNTCLIWKYDKYGFHGYETPLACPPDSSRTTFRLFYYVSSSEYNPSDLPHRSLYWIDPDTQEPYDRRDQK